MFTFECAQSMINTEIPPKMPANTFVKDASIMIASSGAAHSTSLV